MQSKLSEHKFKKGRFVTPANSMLHKFTESSWATERFPEYVWLALIFKHLGRKDGINTISQIYKNIFDINGEIYTPRFSLILAQEEEKQKKIYEMLLSFIDKKVLSPLTSIFTYSGYPIFSQNFYIEGYSIEQRVDELVSVIHDGFTHQSNFATDIRFLVILFPLLKGLLHIPPNMATRFAKYQHLEHSDDEMGAIRSSVRAAEMSRGYFSPSEDYLDMFWEKISSLSECKIHRVDFTQKEDDKEMYIEHVYEIMKYLSSLFISLKPLDDKMLVLIGLLTFSYKRIVELVEHNLSHAISGRNIIRSIIEALILIKFLLKNESSHKNIWAEYKYYGIGLYKLVLARYRESGLDLPDSHVHYDYIDHLINEYKHEEFIDMDTSYFGSQNIRIKAKSVGEEELYGLYYDYDSSFEHSLWGAIRESSLLKCTTSGHQYHCVPDIDNVQNLKSVWHDCVYVMNKILLVINDIYEIPQSLFAVVVDYEKEYFK